MATHNDDEFESETVFAGPDPRALARFTQRHAPTIRWSDRLGTHAHVITERTLLGSGTAAGLRISDPTVSRLHAEVDLREDGAWIRDLRSKNGVFIEGIMVLGGRIPQGARVRLGTVETVWSYESEPTSIELWPTDHFGSLVGKTESMRELFARLGKLAASDAPVLIQGETGTGKEVVAKALHEASPRGRGPLIVVDCGALPENLLEAELFGHAKGAFTGATVGRPGAIEAADGGTVFLDEIGELPLQMQPKLLRAVESRTVRRLGETAYRSVDVRFVSATHRDLQSMVGDGSFREDLYFRLAVLPIRVPPLRERLGDIYLLVQHFLGENAEPIDPSFERELVTRAWPGNVRELRNFVDRVRALGAKEALALSDQSGVGRPPPPQLGASVRGSVVSSAPSSAPGAYPPINPELSFKSIRDDWMDYLEREYLRVLLAKHSRNISAVAVAAGLDRSYIHRLIKRHNL